MTVYTRHHERSGLSPGFMVRDGGKIFQSTNLMINF